jgi:hypothetical protein
MLKNGARPRSAKKTVPRGYKPFESSFQTAVAGKRFLEIGGALVRLADIEAHFFRKQKARHSDDKAIQPPLWLPRSDIRA